ncbi:related to hormone-sensitive lipase [Pseudozyma flocculosa]|uniref:Related to hormone-sensitive lipase n=1 Tax=Pseudozyma flocculosa TaxID=84751 RepID=A0A5C3F3H0_9BASI|nr:related to hormone-sensitive lipase [Pseudozyma flocculosa]
MIDHLLGRPSTRLKRLQVLSVICFWLWYLATGNPNGPRRIPIVSLLNRRLKRFTPWQIVVFCSTSIYAIRHLDSILGLGAPEPLARMYSRSFYRTTWIVTALDAGFATALNIRPQWLKDILSILFSLYYLVYADEADEKLRKFRAFCTIDMMRTTWHKTTNPYIRAATWFHRPSLPIARPLLLPRPKVGPHHRRPIRAWLFYAKSERHLRDEEELVIDFCGGGFVSMNPQHHEERLRQLAKQMHKPVLAIDYCKAPEYPYPYAVEECYDVYRSLVESGGSIIGMSGGPNFRTILSGDSAGGNLATAVVFKVIEYPQPHIAGAFAAKAAGGPGGRPPPLAKPIGVLLSYPALNFGFTSWMKPEHLRVLRQQSEVNLESLASHGGRGGGGGTGAAGKGSSPLNPARSPSRTRRSAINLTRPASRERKQRQGTSTAVAGKRGGERTRTDDRAYHSLAEQAQMHLDERARFAEAEPASSDENALVDDDDDGGADAGLENPYDSPWARSAMTPSHEPSSLPWHEVDAQAKLDQRRAREEAAARAKYEADQKALQAAAEAADLETRDRGPAPVNTRLTMTSMAGYFQDRIITQGMLRAMAILYVGPRRQPDFEHDYFLSPIVAPARLLAEFPPVLFICGEKDPLCDDTVVMAGKIREAKLAKKADLERRRAGGSARFGEQLRMSIGGGAGGGAASAVRDPIEDESPEDWVQMRIIEGWSHGFLQMSSLLPESKQVISFLGTWMSLTFEDHNDRVRELEQQRQAESQPPSATPTALQPRQHDGQLEAASPSPAGRAAGQGQGTPSLQPSAIGGEASPRGGTQPSRQAVEGDADDEDDDEDEDGPITFVPKARRSPSVTPNTNLSPAGSPRIAPRSPELAKPKKLSPPLAAPSGLAHPHVEALRREQQPRGRPASFSNGDVPSRQGLSPPQVASAPGASSPRRRSLDVFGERSEPSSSGEGAAAASPRRGSKNGAAPLDEKYMALLVTEKELLKRRRDDVVFGLGNSASAIESDDDDGDGDGNDGERRRGAAARTGEESRSDTTRGRSPVPKASTTSVASQELVASSPPLPPTEAAAVVAEEAPLPSTGDRVEA